MRPARGRPESTLAFSLRYLRNLARRLATAGKVQPMLFLRVRDLGHADGAVELKRRLVEVIERHGRAEIAADVEAIVDGKSQRGGDGHFAGGDFLAVDLEGDLRGRAGARRKKLGLDLDPRFSDGQFFLRLDLCAVDLEE